MTCSRRTLFAAYAARGECYSRVVLPANRVVRATRSSRSKLLVKHAQQKTGRAVRGTSVFGVGSRGRSACSGGRLGGTYSRGSARGGGARVLAKQHERVAIADVDTCSKGSTLSGQRALGTCSVPAWQRACVEACFRSSVLTWQRAYEAACFRSGVLTRQRALGAACSRAVEASCSRGHVFLEQRSRLAACFRSSVLAWQRGFGGPCSRRSVSVWQRVFEATCSRDSVLSELRTRGGACARSLVPSVRHALGAVCSHANVLSEQRACVAAWFRSSVAAWFGDSEPS